MKKMRHHCKYLNRQCNMRYKKISELANTFVVLGMAMLRGVEGHEFANGFFSGELNNTEKLVIKPEFIQ